MYSRLNFTSFILLCFHHVFIASLLNFSLICFVRSLSCLILIIAQHAGQLRLLKCAIKVNFLKPSSAEKLPSAGEERRSGQVCVLACVSSPGGVYASIEVCTTSERLLDGIGTATFLSTCRASTACTASVWTSAGANITRCAHCLLRFSVFRALQKGSDLILRIVFCCEGTLSNATYRSYLSGSKNAS